MIKALKTLGLTVEPAALSQFAAFKELLYRENASFNLTSIAPTDFDLLHVIDSLTVAKSWTVIPQNIVDIGSGAGFPGIPLAIAFPTTTITLIESNERKVRFLHQVKREVGLGNLICLQGRAEILAHDPKLRGHFELATARAVAELDLLFELLLPFVKLGGVAVAMKALKMNEELQTASKSLDQLGGMIDQVLEFELPGIDLHRSLVVARKISETPPRFPRRRIQ